jgi:HSP20 family molecular chaperone IbpA
MDALMQYPFREKTLETNGLKTLIRRPHNIVAVKDADGNVVSQRLEVVTTPFAKDEVKVTVVDDTLTVECGKENKEEKDEDSYIYKGISSQKYSFSIRLSNKIDKGAIKAKNVDGVLTITLPFKKEEPKESGVTTIAVE